MAALHMALVDPFLWFATPCLDDTVKRIMIARWQRWWADSHDRGGVEDETTQRPSSVLEGIDTSCKEQEPPVITSIFGQLGNTTSIPRQLLMTNSSYQTPWNGGGVESCNMDIRWSWAVKKSLCEQVEKQFRIVNGPFM